MDIQTKHRVIFQSTYYITTLICLGLSVWALRYAYSNLTIKLVLWILVYIAVAAYLVLAGVALYKRWGLTRLVIHTLMLQIVPLLAAILTFWFIPEKQVQQKVERHYKAYKPLTGKVNTYERSFNDMQNKQKAAALANGLPPFKSRAEIEARYKKLRRDKKLVYIETNEDYIVRDLTYSAPYVVPKVATLLDDIAESFQAKTGSNARFMVTSVLRTEEDLKKLRKVNGNASTASCHCNATTIDISYVRFGEDSSNSRNLYELRLALAQTLHELRKEGRCYVKIERKQYCYHITVR